MPSSGKAKEAELLMDADGELIINSETDSEDGGSGYRDKERQSTCDDEKEDDFFSDDETKVLFSKDFYFFFALLCY